VRTSDVHASVLVGDDFLELPGLIRKEVKFLGVGRPNLIWLPQPEGMHLAIQPAKKTELEICRLDDVLDAMHFQSVVQEFNDGTLAVSTNSRSPSSEIGYCVKPSRESDSTVGVIYNVVCKAGDCVMDNRELPPELTELNISIGHGSLDLGISAEEVYIPLDLSERASIECADDLPLTTGGPIRTMRRKAFRRCELKVDLRERYRGRGPDSVRVPGGNPGFQRAMRRLGEQQLQVRVKTAGVGSLLSKERETTLRDSLTINESYVVTAESYQNGVLTIPLDNIDAELDGLHSYELLEISVRHTPPSERAGGLADAKVPFDGHFKLEDASLESRVRVLPPMSHTFCSRSKDASEARRCDHKQNLGGRFWFTMVGSLNAFAFPHSGRGVNRSSEFFNQVETVGFDYGGLLIWEPWNFSKNRPLVPGFNPQLEVGLLTKKDFTDFDGTDWAIVAGASVRLPTSNQPDNAAPEMTAGPFLWYRTGPLPGRINSWYSAVVVGLSITFISLGS